MKLIEQYNNMINNSRIYTQSHSDFSMKNDLLLKTFFEQLNGYEKVLIIGAGNLMDFNVHTFLRFFNEVVLTDIDDLSMRRAVSFQHLSKKEFEKVRIQKVEYTGFEEIEFFSQFKERFVNCLSKEKIDQVINNLVGKIDTYTFLEEEFGTYDFIYVSPIYTQLVYHQVSSLCDQLENSGYPRHLGMYLRESILNHMVDVIERFNKNLVALLKNNGSMMVLSDVFELANNSGFYRRVSNSIKNYDVMEEIYQGYKSKYGMGLGDYGLYNLDDLVDSYLSRWLVWPKDEEESFIVKLKIYNNKGGKQ